MACLLYIRYIQEAERHLNDTATYCKLDADPSSMVYKDSEACVLQLEQQGIFSKVLRDFSAERLTTDAKRSVRSVTGDIVSLR